MLVNPFTGQVIVDNAWSDKARAASLESRRAKAEGATQAAYVDSEKSNLEDTAEGRSSDYKSHDKAAKKHDMASQLHGELGGKGSGLGFFKRWRHRVRARIHKEMSQQHRDFSSHIRGKK